jgi:hypothetical protein
MRATSQVWMLAMPLPSNTQASRVSKQARSQWIEQNRKCLAKQSRTLTTTVAKAMLYRLSITSTLRNLRSSSLLHRWQQLTWRSQLFFSKLGFRPWILSTITRKGLSQSLNAGKNSIVKSSNRSKRRLKRSRASLSSSKDLINMIS